MGKRITSDFWKLSNMFGAKRDRHGTRPWDLQLVREGSPADEVFRAKRLLPWMDLGRKGVLDWSRYTLRYRATTPGTVEDFPRTINGEVLVSERAKTLWESLGPTDCQYLPVTVFYAERKIDAPYYLVNSLQRIDCIDRERSRAYLTDDGETYFRIVVDPRRVPDHVAVLTVPGFGGLIIRERVRLAMLKAKLTGWSTYLP